ncbi:MAG: 4'-phosphopantetheinyl transferase superfamily protein [Bacteroidales bacterium]|nr:4'-phosphopantetheinyl transferase superfamily protein [Bacteroidales bacterium]
MLKKTIKYKDSVILIWEIQESLEKIKKLILNHLTESDFEYLKFLKNERRQKEWLLSRYLIKNACNLENKINIKYDNFGKPYTDTHKISISHSNDYVAVIASETAEVGIDIQKISEITVKVASKFISDEEKSFFDITDSQITTLLWSIKEAAYKFYGEKNLAFIHGIIIPEFDFTTENSVKVIIKNTIETKIKFGFVDEYVFAYTQND